MSFIDTNDMEDQHQQILRNLEVNEEDELSHLNERVFGEIIEQILEEERQQRINNPERINDSWFMSALNGFSNTLLLIVLPMVFTRILLQLLSVSINTSDISYDLAEYFNMTTFDPNDQKNLLLKLHFIFASELSSFLDINYIKYISVFFYLGYSFTFSSYMIFTFMFYMFCIVLTMCRRWSDIKRFFQEVLKSKTGVF